jgi:ABC-2 type transport system permease protein
VRTLIVVKAMFKRYAIELKRYYFNTLSMLASFYFVFLLLFLGVRSFAGESLELSGALGGMVVGFLVFYLTVYAYAELSWVLIAEAQQGTLEQLSMSPLGLRRVLIARVFAALAYRVAIMFLLLVLMMATTGKWLAVDVPTLVTLMLLTVASAQGVGFFMGGLALVFKQIQASLGILQFLFVALIAAPLDRFPWAKLLPLTWGTNLIAQAMIDGTRIWQMHAADLGLLLANATAWFGLGLASFTFFERQARERGLLGHY